MVVGDKKRKETDGIAEQDTKDLKKQKRQPALSTVQIIIEEEDDFEQSNADDSGSESESEFESESEVEEEEIEVSQPISPISKASKAKAAAKSKAGKANENGNGNSNGNGKVNGATAVANGNNNENGVPKRNIIDDQDDDTLDEEEQARALQESELGVIEKITLENFMCHRHFEINLGPNVNFISGENGSGKSALLVALMVCLGAKAGTTNRGHKLADLVKTDANTATVSVKLRNRGNEAYRASEFGDSIIIERKILKNGSGGYKLKDSTGKKTISTKHDDILLILEQFNIQIDNPMAILMQDTSREFLNESSPQAKYNLFLTATQLDQMRKDFNFIDDNIKEIKSILNKKNYIIEEMEKKVAEYTKEYQDLQEVFNLETEAQVLKEKLAWSYVGEIERSIMSLSEELEACNKGSADSQQRIDVLQKQIGEVTRDVIGLREDNAKLTESTKVFDTQRQALHQQLADIQKEEAKVVTKINDLNKRIDINQERKRRQMEVINEHRQKNAQSLNNQAKYDQIQQKNGEVEALEQRLGDTTREREQLKGEVLEAHRNCQESAKSLSDIHYQIQKVEKQITGLKSSKGDHSRVYGDKMPALLKKIKDNQRRFTGKTPIGPIGMSIRVKQEKWAYAIESCLTKRTLKSFIVETFSDGDLLSSFAKELGIQEFEVTCVQKFQDRVYPDIENNFDPKYLTILRAIESDIPHVLNFLIDTKKIQSSLLEEDRHTAERIIYQERPHFLKEAFTLIGDKIYMKGNAQGITTGMKGHATMLQTNVESIIRSLQSQIEAMRPEYQQKMEMDKAAKQQKTTAASEETKKASEINKLNSQIWKLKNEIKNIQDTIVVITDDPTEEWEQGIQQMELENEEHRASIRLQEEERALVIEKRIPVVAAGKELEKEAAKINKLIQTADQKIAGLVKQERDLRQNEGKLLMASAKQSTQMTTIAQQLESAQQSLAEQQEKAEQFCGRVEVEEGETPDFLTREINKKKKMIERETQGRRPRAEVFNSLRDTQSQFDEAVEKRETLKKLCETATLKLNDRFQNWQKFRLKISRRTAVFFNIFLSRKGYSGNIEFNHDEKRLEVNVQLNKMAPAGQQASQPTRNIVAQPKGKGDTKTLSGGERSFSTVSLLLSLWEAMECPFRAMDEFDVFMDEVNRRISIDLLLSKAKENRNRQYIFVTPLPLNSITPSPHIFIHKVRPPIRGQRTIIDTNY